VKRFVILVPFEIKLRELNINIKVLKSELRSIGIKKAPYLNLDSVSYENRSKYIRLVR
jgi:hypothetical protein